MSDNIQNLYELKGKNLSESKKIIKLHEICPFILHPHKLKIRTVRIKHRYNRVSHCYLSVTATCQSLLPVSHCYLSVTAACQSLLPVSHCCLSVTATCQSNKSNKEKRKQIDKYWQKLRDQNQISTRISLFLRSESSSRILKKSKLVANFAMVRSLLSNPVLQHIKVSQCQ